MQPARPLSARPDGATLARDAQGALVRKAGVMAVVHEGGDVRAGDGIRIVLPNGAPRPLEPV